MQHLEDFRKLYFHMCEYIGMESGFSGGIYLCIRIFIHMVGVGTHMQERPQITEIEIEE